MEAEKTRTQQHIDEDEQEMAELSKPVPNLLTRMSIIVMVIGFLLFTIPLVLFPLQASPKVIGIQNIAQLIGLPILGIGLILLFVGLMRAGSKR